MSKRASGAEESKRSASIHRHFHAHQHAKHLGYVRKMIAAARKTSEQGQAGQAITKVARMPIMVAEIGELAKNGMTALRKVGSVTLFLWPGKIWAAGYASSMRPRHFVRVESGDFPKRIHRMRERLNRHVGMLRKLSLVEIRSMHIHFIWAHAPRHSAQDAVVPLLPNLLHLKPGKEYARAEVEHQIREEYQRLSSES
jgi:hypothetical protein